MFVTFEGVDGSGKSTVAHSLARALRNDGMSVLHVDRRAGMPGESYPARHARRLADLLWPATTDEPQHELSDHYFLYLTAAWLQLLDQHVIRPALERETVVVLDGWYYKAAARHQLRPHVSHKLVKECFAQLSKPHLVFFLQIEPEAAANRKLYFSNAECGINDGHEGGRDGFIDYQRRVERGLRQVLADEGTRTVLLDGRASPDSLTSAAHHHVKLTRPSRSYQVRLVDQCNAVGGNVDGR